MVAAGKAIALQNYAEEQAAYRQRVADSHADGRRALGFDAPESGGTMSTGSRILVTGDVYGDEAVRLLQEMRKEQTVQPPPVQQQPSMLSKVAPYLLTAALTAGGMGGAAWLAGMFDNDTPTQPPATVDTDTDTQYILELVPDEQ